MMMDDLSSLIILMIYYVYFLKPKVVLTDIEFYAKDVVVLCSRCYGTHYAMKFYSIIMF